MQIAVTVVAYEATDTIEGVLDRIPATICGQLKRARQEERYLSAKFQPIGPTTCRWFLNSAHAPG